MASLTHVCMWSNKGWKRITAEEAAKYYPYGTVSAHSGLFMCELCGQYVTLTDGNIRTRYFKHSAYEKSKHCPERILGASVQISYSPQAHDLPIRITDISTSSFRFEIGLIRAPINLLNNDLRIEITPQKNVKQPYIFNKERINYDRITYLPIGDRPYEIYMLNFQNGNDRLREFWPEKIKGIDPQGTLFEKTTGKKLTYDSDVEIGKEYYLLIKRGYFNKSSYNSISIQEITQKHFEWETWILYIVCASEFNEEAAKFYLEFHCRLTDNPVSLQPIWPLFVESNYMIKHNQNNMYMIVKGNTATVRTFPVTAIRQLNYNTPQLKIYKISCSDRQQLISTGRTQALEYTYFWKEPLDKVKLQPEISVTDIEGHTIIPDKQNALPLNKTIRFKSTFDGEIIISNKNHIIDKRKLYSDKYVEVDGLTYGLTIQICIGLDIIWQIHLKKQISNIIDNETEILKQINNTSGTIIPIPHSLRNILKGMKNYPRVYQWIKKCINVGTINEQSYRKLQNIYRNININK